MKLFKFILLITLVISMIISCDTKKKENDDINNYREAVNAGDYVAAHKSLDALYEKYTTAFPGYLSDEAYELQKKYYNAFDYIYGKEVQFLLSEFNGIDVADRITFLLNDIPRDGNKFQSGLCDYKMACMENWDGKGSQLKNYVTWVEHYNNLCMKILHLAINRKNEDVVKQVLLCFEDNIEVTKGSSSSLVKIDGVKVDGNHGYIKYTTKDKDSAKEKFEEAKKMGMFNN